VRLFCLAVIDEMRVQEPRNPLAVLADSKARLDKQIQEAE